MMLTLQQTVHIGLIVERIHRLAADLAMQSAQLGNYGRGLAIVADTCRSIGQRLYSGFNQLCEGTPFDLEREFPELEVLSLNGQIEALRLESLKHGRKSMKPLAVIFEELMHAQTDLRTALGHEIPLRNIYPTVSPRNAVITDRFCFLALPVSNQIFYENIQCVMEVVRNGDVQGKSLLLRGVSIPILALPAWVPTGFAPPCYYVILNTDRANSENYFALPVSALPEVQFCDAGVESVPSHSLPSEFFRACWNCEEDRQMLFLDYTKLLTT